MLKEAFSSSMYVGWLRLLYLYVLVFSSSSAVFVLVNLLF